MSFIKRFKFAWGNLMSEARQRTALKKVERSNKKLANELVDHPKFITDFGPFEKAKEYLDRDVNQRQVTELERQYMMTTHILLLQEFGDGVFWLQEIVKCPVIVQLRGERPDINTGNMFQHSIDPHIVPMVGIGDDTDKKLRELMDYATEAQTMEKLAS